MTLVGGLAFWVVGTKNVTWINERWEEIDPITVAFFLGVSKNNGRPQIIHSNRVFHYKPIHFGGFPPFLETSIYVRTTPQPVTVTTRVIPFLVGNPEQNLHL